MGSLIWRRRPQLEFCLKFYLEFYLEFHLADVAANGAKRNRALSILVLSSLETTTVLKRDGFG
jgi:hypothetical protein